MQLSQFYDRGFSRQFLMTSHEVNNTIGATNSLLDSCMDYAEQLTDEDAQDYRQALAVVTKRNSNLAEFMKRLAHVVHLPEPRVVDLVELIDSIQLMFQAQCKQHQIQWQQQLPHSAMVKLDVYLFELVLINLVKNGIEAIEAQGCLTVKLTSSAQGTQLIVEDSAGKLTIEDKDRLFKPFYTTKRNGQGVGLMMVRGILEQHGFDYSLSCEPLRWTRFEISI